MVAILKCCRTLFAFVFTLPTFIWFRKVPSKFSSYIRSDLTAYSFDRHCGAYIENAHVWEFEAGEWYGDAKVTLCHVEVRQVFVLYFHNRISVGTVERFQYNFISNRRWSTFVWQGNFIIITALCVFISIRTKQGRFEISAAGLSIYWTEFSNIVA